MATITEAYCSYEVARLLKEKGFNEPTWTRYEDDNEVIFGSEYVWNNSPMGQISAPTHQMAMKWLREVHRTFICIEFDAPTFAADIYKIDEIDEYGCAKHIPPTIANCKTYEKAVEAAIKYCLENLI